MDQYETIFTQRYMPYLTSLRWRKNDKISQN